MKTIIADWIGIGKYRRSKAETEIRTDVEFENLLIRPVMQKTHPKMVKARWPMRPVRANWEIPCVYLLHWF